MYGCENWTIKKAENWCFWTVVLEKTLENPLDSKEIKPVNPKWIFRVHFLKDWLVWSCCPRDSQESSPVPQFKSINSLMLSFLYGLEVQLSHPYTTTGKTIALTRQIFVGKVMSLLFNMLSRFVIAFLPRSKRLLISWLQSPSAVILESKKIKSVTVSIISLL